MTPGPVARKFICQGSFPFSFSEILDIRDIKGPVLLGERLSPILISGLLLAFLAAAWLLYWIWRRKKGRVSHARSPYEIADEALVALKRKDLIREGRVQDYYAELSKIIRRYLEDQFNCRACEMTTEECLLEIKDMEKLSLEQKIFLEDFLTQCDLVKFAKYLPSQEEMELSFNMGRKIIDQAQKEVVP